MHTYVHKLHEKNVYIYIFTFICICNHMCIYISIYNVQMNSGENYLCMFMPGTT